MLVIWLWHYRNCVNISGLHKSSFPGYFVHRWKKDALSIFWKFSCNIADFCTYSKAIKIRRIVNGSVIRQTIVTGGLRQSHDNAATPSPSFFVPGIRVKREATLKTGWLSKMCHKLEMYESSRFISKCTVAGQEIESWLRHMGISLFFTL